MLLLGRGLGKFKEGKQTLSPEASEYLRTVNLERIGRSFYSLRKS